MEFTDVGKHCAYCNKQDFLPLQCNVCNLWYCKSHSFFSNHGCKISIDTNPYTKKLNKKKKSNYCFKKRYEFNLVLCNGCNKKYCVAHRYKIFHNCVSQLNKTINKCVSHRNKTIHNYNSSKKNEVIKKKKTNKNCKKKTCKKKTCLVS